MPGTGWLQPAVGDHHICARKTDGTVWCNGLNSSGQLGVGDTANRTSFTQAGSSSNWTDLAAAGNSTCALAGTDVWCWGSGGDGLVGIGNADDHLSPTPGAPGAWAALGLGPSRLCLVAASGTLSCAGSDAFGGLGRGGAVIDQTAGATAVASAENWASVAAGASSACAVTTDGRLFCWGSNGSGQLGLGDTSGRSYPTRVGSSTQWAQVSVGDAHACGLQSDSTLWCWGEGADGQTGLNSAGDATVPTRVGSGNNWGQVEADGRHSCALTTGGQLWCWGDNAGGQLGLGTAPADALQPARVGSGSTWTAVAAGDEHTCAVRTGGALWCWGSDRYFSTGSGGGAASPIDSPRQVGASTLWTAVSAGGDNSCGLQSGSALYCWGRNDQGQTGTGSAGTNRAAPYQISSPAAWASVQVAAHHSCGVTAASAFYCWGVNTAGQLGLGAVSAYQAVPQQLSNPIRVLGYAVGGTSSFALIGAYAGAVTADAPSGYWRLGEASGTTATAYRGGPNGTYSGTMTYGGGGAVSGDPDTAMGFNGTSSKAAFGDVHDFAAAAPFTAEVWLRRSGAMGANRGYVFGKHRYASTSDRGGWAISIAGNSDPAGFQGGKIVFGRYGTAGAATEIASSTISAASTWYHVAATYDGTTMRLYVNGVEEASAASGVSVEDHTAALTLGALQTTHFFAGTLDEAAVYPSELSSARVAAHYAARIA